MIGAALRLLARHPLRALGAALGLLLGGAAAIVVDAVGGRAAALAIATVALLVAGAAIGSTLSLELAERTREIGLRMVLGASPQRIGADFLVEGMLLGLLGALAGALFGIAVAELVGERAPYLVRPRGDAVIALVAGALATGIAAGLAPARRASKIDPARVLRRT